MIKFLLGYLLTTMLFDHRIDLIALFHSELKSNKLTESGVSVSLILSPSYINLTDRACS